jgi:hypothetical protein
MATRKTPASHSYPSPNVRPLKVYAFDPTVGKRLNNFMTVEVPYEDVGPGPTGQYIAVVDYDASNNKYYRAVDLQHPSILLRGGLDLNESDPMFHQQMVYAVIMETIKRFEFALGRPIKWRRDTRVDETPNKGRLLVLPHAFQQANAYYDSSLRALLFGYFPAEAGDVGDNLPGQTVFTCLSHDIIAHETTHALVDGLREYFMKPTNFDVPAFHEAFADIVALFQHFSYEEALLDTIQRTGGLIYRDLLPPDAEPNGETPAISAERKEPNFLVGLAQQFGQAAGMRGALRSALGKPADASALAKTTEAHERGAILVATVFDAYFTV